MRMNVAIPYPKTKAGKTDWSRRYGLNAYWSGKHWAKRKEDARYWHTITRAQLTHPVMLRWPVGITFFWNDNLDLDNHAAMGKMIVDALKGLLIPDDGRRQVVQITHRYHDLDFILVEVEEL